MPHQLTIRNFQEGGYYHIFNRGNAKKKIFRSQDDYKKFLSMLQECLSLPSVSSHHRRKNFHGEILLIAFCLMPNHFHFCVQQKGARVLAEFMQSLMIRYSIYFNAKYKKVGHLFQDKYKARLITTDGDLLNITSYIHRNPLKSSHITTYPYSSLQGYLVKGPSWYSPEPIFSLLKTIFGIRDDRTRLIYKKFVLHARQ